MDVTTYKEALQQAKRDLSDRMHALAVAQEQAAEAERDIIELRQTIAALAKLCDEPEFVEEDALGLTDAIRMAFRTAGRDMSAHDVRTQMESMGYAGRWGNLLASIHTVTKRLHQKGEIQATGNVNGRDMYRWIENRSVASVLTEAFGRPATPIVRTIKLPPPPAPAGGVPSPHGKNLGEMLKEPRKK